LNTQITPRCKSHLYSETKNDTALVLAANIFLPIFGH
jgi:hypothetical protein